MGAGTLIQSGTLDNLIVKILVIEYLKCELDSITFYLHLKQDCDQVTTTQGMSCILLNHFCVLAANTLPVYLCGAYFIMLVLIF